MRIGLVGGSFDPPHSAHRAMSLFAMKRLKLDRIWWLVTPGNPLKSHDDLPPLGARIVAARDVANDPRIQVTGIEQALRTRYTVDTIGALRQRCVDTHFVWIMGADNLTQFHRWKDWRGIAETLPIAVIDRASLGLRALASPAAQAMARHRLPEGDAQRLAASIPPAWVFLSGLKLTQSSTALRGQQLPTRAAKTGLDS